jgi:hypothetical protein
MRILTWGLANFLGLLNVWLTLQFCLTLPLLLINSMIYFCLVFHIFSCICDNRLGESQFMSPEGYCFLGVKLVDSYRDLVSHCSYLLMVRSIFMTELGAE